MNITLSIDKRLAEKARRTAGALGMSLNEMIRRYLLQVTGEPEPAEVFQELKTLLTERGGHSGGWRFDRDEIHERESLPGYERPGVRRRRGPA